MGDQPDKTPPPELSPDESWQTPDSAPPPDYSSGWLEPPVEEGSSRPVIAETWFEPVNAVSEPDSPAAPPDGGTNAERAQAPLPGVTPARAGDWHTSPEANLNELLAGIEIVDVSEPELLTPLASSPPDAGWQAQAITDQEAGEAEAWQMPLLAADQAAVLDGTQPQAAADTQPQMMDGGGDQAGISPADEGVQMSGQTHAAAAIEEPAIPAESTPPAGSTPSKGLSPAEAAFLAEQRATVGGQVAGEYATSGHAAGGQDVVTSDEPANTGDQPAAQPGQPVRPEQPVQSTQPAQQAQPAQPVKPDPFADVERKVVSLRQRYNSGYLTREQLQNELRSMMILDDDGRWWMLGLESNRWYYFDGRNWVPAEPPRPEQDVIRGSAVPTETGLQEAIAAEPGAIGPQHIEIDEDGMPLPQRVPQDDLGATIVSEHAPFMEPVRRSEAPTLSHTDEVGPAVRPVRGQEFTQPTRPDAANDPTLLTGAVSQPTLRSDAVRAEPTVRGIPVPSRQAAAVGSAATATSEAAAVAGDAISRPGPKPKIGEFPQPDYSVALGVSHNRSTYAKWGIRFGIFALIGGMAITLIALLAMMFYYFAKVNQYQSAVNTLRDRASNFETTLIYDADGGEALARFNDPNTGSRRAVALDKISPWLIHATVATENETFYTDPGFSVLAIVRATIQNLQAGGTVSGASTITQQLARALVLDTEFAYQRTTERKIVEVIVASEIKRKYTKNEILEIYLNEIFYGNLAYGVEAAAQTYFGKAASDLNPAEAAFLAGLPQSPATYDPVVNHEAAVRRMNDVLRLMSEADGTGCIAIQHADTTKWAVPDGGSLCIIAQETGSGDVVYYYQSPGMAQPEELTLDIAIVQTTNFKRPEFRVTHPHFVNYVWQQLEDTYGSQAIYSAGYRVYTTLDENIQSAAEQSVSRQLADLQARGIDATNASVVVMRPADGAVLAMVGSADYYNENIDGQVNVSLTAQQPGSAIKPFVYLTAFMPNSEGKYWTPATVVWDIDSDFNGYRPTNFDLLFHGPQSVRQSLGNSFNIPAVKALNFAGIERFTDVAREVGLTFPLGSPVERQAGLPTALGAVEIRLIDMVTAYGTLANNGRRVEPYAIMYIQDSDGNEIYRASTSPEGEQKIPAQYAYLVTDILADPEARTYEFGRGWPMELQGGRPAAVKTGTTDDSRDIWTVGYTPQRVVGVWVGNTDNRPVYGAYGYTGAAPIWNDVMEAAHSGLAIEQFQPPQGIVQMEVCADSGAQPSQACAGRTYTDVFASSALPPAADQDIFRRVEVDSYTLKLVNDSCRDMVETRTFVVFDDPAVYNWINNTAEGNTWAQTRGIDVPVMPPPTEYCDPNLPRPKVILSYPVENATIKGLVPLRGAIMMADFNRYEVRYGESHDPQAFSQAVIVDTTQRPEGESMLGEFDARALPDGPYTIQLVAIDNVGRSVTRVVHVVVDNPEPTPMPTSLPTPTLAPTLFAPTPGGVSVEQQQVQPQVPTLTPTWTLTPTPQQ